MSAASKYMLFALSSLLFAPGCLTTHLRNNTIAQMETVHDLQQQQVLDNLAMFVENIDAYPYFSLVLGGTSQLTDTATLAITNSWSRVATAFVYSSLGINPSVMCQANGQWQITPINDSVKLTVMRCVYQKAVAGCCGRPMPADCPGCNALIDFYYPKINSFRSYNGKQPEDASPENAKSPALLPPRESPLDESKSKGGEKPKAKGDDKPKAAAAEGPAHMDLKGMITPDCIANRCWFCWGCKSDVPKDCNCLLVGHHCDTYVWVPMEGRDELSKLTLLVLDIAYYNPPQPAPPGSEEAYVTGFIRTRTTQPSKFFGIFALPFRQNRLSFDAYCCA